MKAQLLFLLLCLSLSPAWAQDAVLDSLLKVLKTTPNDTVKLPLLNAIIDIAPDGEWQKYNEQMGQLALQTMSSQDSASQRSGKKYYATNQNNLAFDYFQKGDFKNALQYYSRSLKLSREIGDPENESLVLSNIGAIYDRQSETGKALEFYGQALSIQRKTNDTTNIISTLNNIGALYNTQKNYDSALIYYQQSLNIIQKKRINTHTTTTLYANLGTIMLLRKNIEKALEYHQQGLAISEIIGDNSGKSINLKGLANVYFSTGNATKALPLAQQALDLARTSESLREIMQAAELLKGIYKTQGNFKQAFDMYALEMATRDSLNRKENERAIIRTQFQYDYDVKEATAKAEQEKKDGIARAELKRQKVQKLAFLCGFGVMVLFAAVFFRQRNKISREKKRSDELLLNILPEEVAEELKANGEAEARQMDDVTVLFTDFKGFTTMSEKLTPKALVKDIHECFSAFDHIMEKYGMEKIKTIGDSYMAASGLPTPNKAHALHAVKAALEIRQFIEEGKIRKMAAGLPFFEIRIGIHSGSVVAGIVGVKKFAYDIWGDTVNTASRMESSGEVGQINISGSTFELVKDQFTCTHRGKIEAKGKGGIDMYFVEQKVQ